MTFWELTEPDYNSDYKSNYINGSADHIYGLPGVECEICGNTWGGSRILIYGCPDKFKVHKSIIDSWPIKREVHEKLQEELCRGLNIEFEPFTTLQPGDRFQPCFIDIPSMPSYDFLWSSIGSLIVSERILKILETCCKDEFEYSEVIFRKVGKRKSKQKPFIPTTGEPEDQINEVKLLDATDYLPKYYEIIIKKETEYPKGCFPIKICAGCKHESIDDEKRILKMDNSLWKGDNIFYLKTTLYIIITDNLKSKLEKVNPTNVVFKMI